MPENKNIKNTSSQNGQIATAGQLKISTRGSVVRRGTHKVDVVFVFDTTGSMTDKINGLLRTCSTFVQEANALDLDPQFALISFGDILVEGGGDRIDLVVPLTGDIDRITHGLSNTPRNNGFGNDGESAFEAAVSAFQLPYREKAVKVLILITDEPAHQVRYSPETMINTLAEREFLVFTVATEAWYYKALAERNGGTWKKIGAASDFKDILDMFRDLARKVAKVASDVQRLADGSVSEYLRLNPPHFD